MHIYQLGIALLALGAILVSLLISIGKTLKHKGKAAEHAIEPERDGEDHEVSPPPTHQTEPDALPGRMRRLVPAADLSVEQLLTRADAPAGYLTALEHRLEQAFESYLRERISIETYADIIRSEKRAAHRFQAELSSRAFAWPDPAKTALSPEDEDIFRQIDEALTWCHDWAVERGASQPGFAPLASHDSAVL